MVVEASSNPTGLTRCRAKERPRRGGTTTRATGERAPRSSLRGRSRSPGRGEGQTRRVPAWRRRAWGPAPCPGERARGVSTAEQRAGEQGAFMLTGQVEVIGVTPPRRIRESVARQHQSMMCSSRPRAMPTSVCEAGVGSTAYCSISRLLRAEMFAGYPWRATVRVCTMRHERTAVHREGAEMGEVSGGSLRGVRGIRFAWNALCR